ncbi:MAG: 4-hydroxy-tetrahydrodipicolinate synthase [Bacillota bacterium]
MLEGNLYTAMVTPFTESGEVNYEKARELASYLIAEGCDGLVICGTTGEVPTLSHQEKLTLLQNIVAEVGAEAEIIAGTGSYNTEDSIALSREAEEIGVDGVMLVVPYYNKPPQGALYQHFKTVAESIELPVLLYNVPGRTSRNMEAETTIQLAEIDNIVAIKEASGDFNQATEIIARAGDKIDVYSGDDSLTLPLMSLGGKGVVSVAGHLVAAEIKDMIALAMDNDFKRAAEINKKLFPIFTNMFISTNPIPVKTALNMQGWDLGGFRQPLAELEESKKDLLKNLLKTYKLL